MTRPLADRTRRPTPFGARRPRLAGQRGDTMPDTSDRVSTPEPDTHGPEGLTSAAPTLSLPPPDDIAGLVEAPRPVFERSYFDEQRKAIKVNVAEMRDAESLA